MYKKILSWLLTFIMVFSMFGGISLEAFGLPAEPECKIGETEYEILTDALTASVDGDTIILLKDVNHTGKITITGKKITFDLNGFNLNVSNTGDTTVEVGAGGEIDLTGEGEFNVTGTNLGTTGYYDLRGTITIKNGGKITVTNVTSTGNSGYPVYGLHVSEGSVTILGNVETSGTKRIGVFTTGSNSSALVHGSVSSLDSIAIQLHDNSSITVDGDVEGIIAVDSNTSLAIVKGNAIGTSEGVRAISGGKVYIGGNATSSGNNSHGAYSVHEDSFISVSGSAISYGDNGRGSFAGAGGEVLIGGNSESQGNDGKGVYSTSNATVTVEGDVLSENGTGVWAWHSSEDKPFITINGEIIAETFIEFDINDNLTTYDKGDYVTPTTKEGYFTYTDSYSTVWLSYPAVWGIEIESIDTYPFGGGDGSSEETAYEISTANQMAQFEYNVNNGNKYTDKYFKLSGDINLSGKEWVPIGKDYNRRFMGNFDGDNFKIEGLTITDISYSDNYGLFGYLGENGVISNLIIESGKIELTEAPTNNSGIGGIAGYSTGLISNCTNKLDIIADHSSEIYAGGIVGLGNCNTNFPYDWSGRIENCHNEGEITLGDRGSAGGIIGIQFNSNSHTYLRNCSNKGNITGGASVEIGGIAGWLHGTYSNNPIINCSNTGNLRTGSLTPDAYIDGNIGGIVGYLYSGVVENSYNTGSIEVLYRDITNTSGFHIGGIVGYGGPPVVKNSYNSGIITGPEDKIGPMSGANNNYSSHENCYYREGSIPDSVINTGAMKLTGNQMKGIDNSEITFINSSDEEITYGPANGALLYALNNGKSVNGLGWISDEENINYSYPIFNSSAENPYTLSFDSQGGTAVSAITVTDGDSIDTSPSTTRIDYDFDGWFTDSSGGTEVTFPFTPDESIISYAQWSKSEPEEPTPTTRPSVPTLEVETTSLLDGAEGEEYEVELEADGGISPYGWSAEGLPIGLSISEEGVISGIPEEFGNFEVKVELMDNRNYYKSKVFDLLIEGTEEDSQDSDEEESMENIFVDTKDHWSKDYINEVVSKNIVNGYPDGTFKPENKITREEFASMLVRALGLEIKTGVSFDDSLGRWSTDRISTAVYFNIIKGYNETTFGPSNPITREQMAVMIVRALNLDEKDEETNLSDIDAASSWAKSSIIAAVKDGLLDGYPDGTFRPQNNLTRAEAIKVIFNLLNNLENSN